MQLLLPLLCAASAAAASSAGAANAASPLPSDAWTRGSFGKLAVSADGSMNFKFGAVSLAADAPNGTSGTKPGVAGTDPRLGSYDELLLPAGAAGGFAIRYYERLDAFTFERHPRDPELLLDATFPRFDGKGEDDGNSTSVQAMGWSNHYFYPGGVGSLAGDQMHDGDGPLFLFEPVPNGSTTTAAAMGLSPLRNFSLCAVEPGILGMTTRRPAQASSALLLARPGFVRANRALGSVLRQAHATTRRRGIGTSGLSYWNDNQAGYSWWSVGPDQMLWGQPEKIYTTLKHGYDAAKIPITNWEPDNHLVVDFHTPKKAGECASGWIYKDFGTWNTELYPSGGNLSHLLGGIPLTFYYNGFAARDNAYANSSEWGKDMRNGEILPLSSYDFHKEIFGKAVREWNMQQLFTDFLSFRGGAQRTINGHDWGKDEPEHLWLGGQALAAQDLGAEVQFCMAAAHQLLMSLEWPSVTNARANGDGGLDLQALIYPSVLASMVGLGWSKDNLRTADKCFVNATFENGSIAFPCDGKCATQYVNGQFKSQIGQTVLASLSLGPVGISDQLSARPEEPGAKITSNRTLVMATCASNGSLLQPSYPLTPIEPVLLHADGWQPSGNGHHGGRPHPAPHVWATYTAVSTGEKPSDVDVHFVAVGYWLQPGKQDPEQAAVFKLPVTLEEKHLASMVDAASLPSPEGISAIPNASFGGAGDSFPNATTDGYVWWAASLVQQSVPGHGCDGVEVSAFEGSIALELPASSGSLQPSLVNVAPLHGDTALLGEAGKVSAVSAFRFASVTAGTDGLSVAVRGAPAETVELIFAKNSAAADGTVATGASFVCVSKQVTIGTDGTALVHSAR